MAERFKLTLAAKARILELRGMMNKTNTNVYTYAEIATALKSEMKLDITGNSVRRYYLSVTAENNPSAHIIAVNINNDVTQLNTTLAGGLVEKENILDESENVINENGTSKSAISNELADKFMSSRKKLF
jgi:hypothetical protein